MNIVAIDPGPVRSGVVWLDGGKVLAAEYFDNEELLDRIYNSGAFNGFDPVIEMIASYGMAVGAEVFETCVWIGRIIEAIGRPVLRVKRLQVKVHLCHSAKAKDSNVRQALIDRFGPQGTKKNPGPTYGMKGDLWAALAVAVYAMDSEAR